MPPSPVFRISPAREVKTENHRRGRSLEGGLLFKDKDEDLALFKDMQNRERDNFLLTSADDMDDSLSTKLRYFSDFKLGISIPVRGESSDLLNADGDKNDYDWLMTPPDTPLFPSLDDDPPPSHLMHRGRPRSQPIIISRSAKAESTHKSSRSSASPNRLSPSSRSCSTDFQPSRGTASPHQLSASPQSGGSASLSRGRPSFARPASPTPSLQSLTSSRRPSTPPNKPSSPVTRSSTPTLRRMSAGSSSLPSSSGRRTPSPGKANRGNSASPKSQAWQSTLPGFSSDRPPNLRTSLMDSPSSNGRGMSPAPSRRRDLSSKFARLSMSPTASRNVSSSHSHERDHLSSRSKGSLVSSSDDGVDSPHSVIVGLSESPGSRKHSPFAASKAGAFSKRISAKTYSASSAPKKSFDSALRQDHRKSPQNMFRPLLSSVPTTTLLAGKAATGQHSMISRNSSVTNSSNTSSEQCTSVAHDTEGSEHDQDVQAGEWGKPLNSNAQEEIFIFDKADEVIEDSGHEFGENLTNFADDGINRQVELRVAEGNLVVRANNSAHDSSFGMLVPQERECCQMMASCYRCGCKFHIVGPVDANVNICPACAEKDGPLTPISSFSHSDITWQPDAALLVDNHSNDLHLRMRVHPNTAEANRIRSIHDVGLMSLKHSCLSDSSLDQLTEKELCSNQSNVMSKQQLCHFNSFSSLKIESSERMGIPSILKRSISSKWPVVQGRSFIAENFFPDDLSYTRGSMNAVKKLYGQGSASASSSVDLNSTKQNDTFFLHQLSSRIVGIENSREDSRVNPISSTSSFSGISMNTNETLVHMKSTSEENSLSVRDSEQEYVQEVASVKEGQLRHSGNTEAVSEYPSFFVSGVNEEQNLEVMDDVRVLDAPSSALSNHTRTPQSKDSSNESLTGVDSFAPGNTPMETEVELVFSTTESSVLGKDSVVHVPINEFASTDLPILESLHKKVDEALNEQDGSAVLEMDCMESPNLRSRPEMIDEPLVSSTSEKDSLDMGHMTSKVNISDHPYNINESTISVGIKSGLTLRSFSLDEATDTILFCSSIIHDLAYKAASIAVEKKDEVPLEASRPTVTILGKTDTNNRRDLSRPRKRMSKSLKPKRNPSEADTKVPSFDAESNPKTESLTSCDSAAVPNKPNGTDPPKLESRCNCTVM